MPITFWTFLIGGLALSGFPLVTAGFLVEGRDPGRCLRQPTPGSLLVLAVAALLTAFYTARQITLTFLGKPRTEAAEHAHENDDLDDDRCR
jgi:NADH-quinone oxidoreductase subunit L